MNASRVNKEPRAHDFLVVFSVVKWGLWTESPFEGCIPGGLPLIVYTWYRMNDYIENYARHYAANELCWRITELDGGKKNRGFFCKWKLKSFTSDIFILVSSGMTLKSRSNQLGSFRNLERRVSGSFQSHSRLLVLMNGVYILLLFFYW